MKKPASFWIKKLGLEKHPEGGYFRETYRSLEKHPGEHLPERYTGGRNFSTCIYYLLEGEDFSALHRIRSDEIWHFYSGCTIMIYIISPDGRMEEYRLGQDAENGDELQLVIPKMCWFAAELTDKNSYGLVGCTVSPGFDFMDFELADKESLLKLYPEKQEIISRLSL